MQTDNLLFWFKEIKNPNSTIVQFGFNNKNDNLMYNLSYLCSIVHPLIILRLLEHRLFTPLSRKKTESTTTVPTTSFNNGNSKSKINGSSSFPINYDLLINNSESSVKLINGSRKSSQGDGTTSGRTSTQQQPKAMSVNFALKEPLLVNKPFKSLKPNSSSFVELNEMMRRPAFSIKQQRSRHNSIKSMTKKRHNVKSSKSNSNLKTDADHSTKNFNFANFV
jgi:hypothetical protein